MPKQHTVNRFEILEMYERLDTTIRARNGLPALTPADEADAAAKLEAWLGATTTLRNGATVPVLNIVTNESMADFATRAGGFQETFGVTSPADPDAAKKPHYNRLEAVAEITRMEGTKIVEFTEGALERVPAVSYEAVSARYTMPDGRQCQDSTRSGPEAFERDTDGNIGQVGAATALLRRLIEAVALN